MIVMGGIVGAGIFINPYVVAQQVHTPMLILGAWVVGGLIALAGAFVYAELAARMPDVGGQYAYLRESYHPAVAFLYGWVLLLVIQTGGMAAVSITFARYFLDLAGTQASEWLLAAVALAVLTVINCLGVKQGSAVQSALMVLKIVAITALVFCGAFLLHRPSQFALHPMVGERPSLHLLSMFGAAMVPVLFAYGGWQTANFIGGEIKDPRRNLPRALLIGVCGVIALYVGVSWVCVRALGAATLAETHTPASAVMRIALGQTGVRLIAVGIAISTLGFLSQSILTAPRVYFAMAADGLFFRAVARIHPRTRVPVVAIILQSVWTMVIAASGRYEQILNYVVAMDFIFFGLTATCIFILRRRDRTHRGIPRARTSRDHRIVCRRVLAGGGEHDLPLSRQQPGRHGHPGGRRAGVLFLERAAEGKCGRKMNRTTIFSPYMEFAKLRSSSRFNLATSGIMSYPLSELPVAIDQLEINGPDGYGYEPLIERLAAKNKVAPECVVYINGGTSLANNVAIAGTTETGDHVLAETPGYELLDTTARFLGLEVGHFERRPEDGFRLDPREIERRLTPRTRLIIITNLHNPSGVLADEETLRQIGDIARSAGARVLVDEVYLDMAFEQHAAIFLPPRPENICGHEQFDQGIRLERLALRMDSRRASIGGAILAHQRSVRGHPVHAAELLSVIALDNLGKIAARAQTLLEKNRALLNRFFDSCGDLEIVRPEFGTVAFPRLRQGSVENLFTVLRDKYEATVVPGGFFGAPQHFRIGVGGDTEMTREGLDRLASALRELATNN